MLKTLCAITAVISITAATAFPADWPNFHGPGRTNKSAETGLLKSWPAGGPRLIWTASNIGTGFSGAATANGVVYTAGVRDNASFVFAFNTADGKPLWETRVGSAWVADRAFARRYHGSRATPTVAGGMVYFLSDAGILAALDARTGAQRWNLNIQEKYDAPLPGFGYSESPLVIGDRIFVSPYGKKATIVALDRNTGKPVWETKGIAGGAGYASPVAIQNSGLTQLVSFTDEFLYAVNAADGKVLWTVPVTNSRKNNCNDIVYHDGHVFATSGYGRGALLVKLEPKTGGGVNATKVYDVTRMDNLHGGVILHEGRLYGSGHESRGWFCLDFKTGRQIWNAPGKGSITFADGMLYLYDEDHGTVSLARV